MFKDYYELTKPGIIYGNAIALIAGFAVASARVASGGRLDVGLFAAALFGLSFVIASGCVFNNYLEREIDAKMGRTKDRPLVTGRISNRSAVFYGICLGACGFGILFYYTNLLTGGVAALGFFVYVFLYSLWFKRRTSFGTLIGSVAGAVPPVVGYTAASGRLDLGAWLLFAILICWQMPHFYSIAIRRSADYAAAGIPVLPLTVGMKKTKIAMIFYIVAFIAAVALLAVFGYINFIFAAIAALLGALWLFRSLQGFWAKDNVAWARSAFLLSLIVLLGTLAAITFGALYRL